VATVKRNDTGLPNTRTPEPGPIVAGLRGGELGDDGAAVDPDLLAADESVAETEVRIPTPSIQVSSRSFSTRRR
jgi:hypothetical protein